MGNTTAALLLTERWAEPMPFDAPLPQPFVNEQPVDLTAVLRRRELVRQLHPPAAARAKAADSSAKPRR